MSLPWLVFLVAWTAPAQSQGPLSDTGYTQSFQCPESLATPEERIDAVSAFVTWAQRAHPDWTLAEFTSYRMQLLVEHQCEATLATIRSRAQAESAPEPAPEPVEPEPTDSPMSNAIVVIVAIVGAFVLVRLTRRSDSDAQD